MKPPAPLSAFAVYNKILKQKSTDNTNKKSKLKSKSKHDGLSAFKSNIAAMKGLNKKKILMAIEESSDLPLKTNKTELACSKKDSTKGKHKTDKKDKDSPDYKIAKNNSPKKRLPKSNGSTSDQDHSVSNSEENSVSDENQSSQENTGIQQDIGDPLQSGLEMLEWMISPIDHREFFKTFWENEPLYISRSNKKYHSHLFSSAALDTMIRENDLFYTRNVDVVTYDNAVKEVLNPEGKANTSALWDFYSNGCSIRVLNPQTYNKKIHMLLSTLQEYFGSMVGANVYLTPPGSQGFAPHYDDIEAFVLQIEGRKHWKLYHPKDEDMLTRHSSKDFNEDDIGEPFMEVILEAGSMLYFPRGIIHQGRTDPDSHSLHITVSVYQNNAYVDLLEKALPQALLKAAKSDIDFRRGLPLHFMRSRKAKKIMGKKVTGLIDKLKEYLDIEDGLADLGRKLVYDSMPPTLSSDELAASSKQGGDLLSNGIVYNKVEFDLGYRVRLTRYHCIQLGNGQESTKLFYSTENAKVYHGEEEQWLQLEPSMVPLIKFLQKSYPNLVRIEDLPLDDSEVKIQLVYDLWEKGILLVTPK